MRKAANVDIPADAKPVPASIPSEMIEAFVAATTTAFQELTNTETVAREPFVVDRLLTRDVNATVVLRHDPPGRLILSFPLLVLEAFVSRYVAGAATLTPELLDDAAGEFANVIAGQAKTILKGTPEHYWLSTPVVSRAAASLAHPEGASIVTLFFDCDAGTFVLQVIHW
jgi:CheY-specific phosphatase CheX